LTDFSDLAEIFPGRNLSWLSGAPFGPAIIATRVENSAGESAARPDQVAGCRLQVAGCNL
jgi:hypothetical protein